MIHTPDDSPALRYQCAGYPPEWEGRVPLRVRVLSRDLEKLPAPEESLVWTNSHGQVWENRDGVIFPLTPKSFEVLSFHADNAGHKTGAATAIPCAQDTAAASCAGMRGPASNTPATPEPSPVSVPPAEAHPQRAAAGAKDNATSPPAPTA